MTRQQFTGLQRVLECGSGGQGQFDDFDLSRRRAVGDLNADHRAPYTYSARPTKQSTSVLATRSNTGLTTNSSALLENA